MTIRPPIQNKLHLLNLAAFEATYHDAYTPMSPDMHPLVIDTGASITVTPHTTDFISPIRPVQQVEIKGIASGLKVAGIGTAIYQFYNDTGEVQVLQLENCLYVPQCTTRLLCPRQIGHMTGNVDDGFFAKTNSSVLYVAGKPTTIRYDTTSNLPILYTTPGISSFYRFCANHGILHTPTTTEKPTPLNPQYRNLTPRQHKKLQLHERCAHAHFEQINSWIRSGCLPCDPDLATEPDPLCATCQFGKAHKRSHKSNTGHIAKSAKAPGDGVSSDGMEAGTPGRLMTTSGLPSTKRYRYCSFWVDHFSQFVYVTMHETKRAEELLRSKLEFEDFASKYNVNIRNIRADNGVYTAKCFQEACLKKQQTLTFCAVGAHWQNGIAERFIGSITQRARTILLHAMTRWPNVITEDMWPFAIRHAVTFHNASIRRDKNVSPYKLFTGEDAPWNLNDFRVFGCPVYVLQKRLQDGDSFPKWKARSWQGAYVGHSTCHASNIPLVYNFQTTHVTPQYHLVFDEAFTSITDPSTAASDAFLENLYNTATWLHKSAYSEHTDEYYFASFWMDPPLAPKPELRGRKRKNIPARGSTCDSVTSLPIEHEGVSLESTNQLDCTSETTTVNNKRHGHSTNFTQQKVQAPLTNLNPGIGETPLATTKITKVQEPPNTQDPSISATLTVLTENLNTQSPNLTPNDPSIISNNIEVQAPPNTLNTAPLDSGQVGRCQYNIFTGSPSFCSYKKQKGIDGQIYILNAATSISPHSQNKPTNNVPQILPHVFSAFYDLPIIHSESTIQSFLAMNNKDDTLTQSQMLKTPDKVKFISAQMPEIKGLEDMGVFHYKAMSELPATAKLLSSIWSYRRKRRPNGALLKHKARICVDGSQQQFGRDYWETFAPVVTWSTVRLVLLLSTILNLKSRQVDYTQAFPQAELTDPVYMRLPQGWFLDSSTNKLLQHSDPKYNDITHFIQLKRNLYGCKQAARNWYHHLNNGILAEGFYQSKIDPCLYLRHDCIIVLYTDDTLIFARDDNIIDSVITNLSKTFRLEDQGNVNDFLGIRITTEPTTKTITMTQTGLIESIIQDVGLKQDSTIKHTPSDSILYADYTNTPREDSWNYRSVIGKLNFLAQNTRPDISFAVHQCARFCTKPTKLHEIAVKRIARYLLFTKDNGLILHPTKDFNLDMYVDADFAGMWHQEHSALRDNVLSRTGYIITFCGCPIHWTSKLQSEIALSSTESEYIALSMATRELLPLRRILLEINQHSLTKIPLQDHFNTTHTPTLSASQIYEDNAACIVLAHSDTSKVRTKHIAIKWHHFKDQVRKGHIKIVKIDTHHNWADIFTKPLGRQKFETLRKLAMGW